MIKTCSAKNVQQEFPSLLGRVRKKQETIIVEDQGRPVVAMIPFDRYQALTKRRAGLFAVLDRIWAKNRTMSARDAHHDATHAVKQARAARRSRGD
jgi:antitoxin (DNA-binding transcriptional repressor) of toxin-antitoxin stability system